MTAIAVAPMKLLATLTGSSTLFQPLADVGNIPVVDNPTLSAKFVPDPAACMCPDVSMVEQLSQLKIPPMEAAIPDPLVVPGTIPFTDVPGNPPGVP